jgi:CheY-like chemotaxis protein/anti-sigma regulatory factor (Ser/Thr protein kinase)
VNAAIETCQPLLDSNRHFSIALPQQLVLVEVDPERIAQVIINLLHNAFKYTAADGRIELIAEVENAEVALRVRDNGIGITPELIPRIFDMYSQAEAPLHAENRGLGVGLSLVRQLVELHGGSVSVQSEGSQTGSEFLVHLPIVVEAVADEPRTAQPAAPALSAETAHKILVVDDHADAADALWALLESAGHQVISCYDGPTALDVARQHPRDIAILDIGMPGMDGYELARRLRESNPETMLIALSGWSAEEKVSRARDAGFDHYLTKPVRLHELTKLLSTYRRPKASIALSAVRGSAPSSTRIAALKLK